jgi:FKBP-type peptidyl-prolyl cis-trans isomerase
MRVGGRRKLVVPTNLTFKRPDPSYLGPDGTVIYVIDLLEVKPP